MATESFVNASIEVWQVFDIFVVDYSVCAAEFAVEALFQFSDQLLLYLRVFRDPELDGAGAV